MKKIIGLSIATALIGTLLLTSCATEDDPTATPTSTDPRAKFHGNWSVAENSTDYGTSTYNCTITDSSDASHIFIAYLYGFNKKIYSTVSGNTFVIPSQIVQGNSVSGSGTSVNANQINMTYLVRTTISHYDTVTAVLTK
ncbi:MAG: hypothetical protein V4608_01595 [Bacteroidota bacterium]